jgi:hypothetical protein
MSAPKRGVPELHRPVPEWSAKPCPFCGWTPNIQGWHGAPVLLSCDYERCHVQPSVTGDARRQVLSRWNRRATA